MAAATLLGALVVTLTVLGVDVIRSGVLAGPPAPGTPGVPPGSAAVALLLGGTLGGFALAGTAAWWLLAPLGSLYRRGALAVASSFGTVVLMLLAVPVHQWLGQPGLLGLAALLGTGALALARRARRAAAEP